MNAAEKIPPVQRPRKGRDLTNAITLRPRDVYDLYGIPASTLHGYCNHPDPACRLPSLYLPGRGGKFGVRMIKRVDIEAWLEKHRAKPAA